MSAIKHYYPVRTRVLMLTPRLFMSTLLQIFVGAQMRHQDTSRHYTTNMMLAIPVSLATMTTIKAIDELACQHSRAQNACRQMHPRYRPCKECAN